MSSSSESICLSPWRRFWLMLEHQSFSKLIRTTRRYVDKERRRSLQSCSWLDDFRIKRKLKEIEKITSFYFRTSEREFQASVTVLIRTSMCFILSVRVMGCSDWQLMRVVNTNGRANAWASSSSAVFMFWLLYHYRVSIKRESLDWIRWIPMGPQFPGLNLKHDAWHEERRRHCPCFTSNGELFLK